jgi:Nitrile hydratase beta subunit
MMPDPLVTDLGGHAAGEIPKHDRPMLYWEKLMLAMLGTIFSKGIANLDEFRRTVEMESPQTYESSDFYWRRLDAMAHMMIEKGLVNNNELIRRTNERLQSGRRDHAV